MAGLDLLPFQQVPNHQTTLIANANPDHWEVKKNGGKMKKKYGPCESRTHDLRVISTTLCRLS